MLKTNAPPDAAKNLRPKPPSSNRARGRKYLFAGQGHLSCDCRPTGLVRYLAEATGRDAAAVDLFMFSPYLPALRGQHLTLQLEDGRQIHFTGDGEVCQVVSIAVARPSGRPVNDVEAA